MKNRIMIGLCGRSGSGKSYVCRIFEELRGLHLDTDRIYHELLLPVNGEVSSCAAELANAFGEEIITKDNNVDRKKLSSVVFSDGKALSRLNEITHKYIFEETMRRFECSDAPFAVMDAPVLFESGFDKYCDFTVCVTADDEICVKRITERDGISADRARMRLENQLSREKLVSLCDYEIVNNGEEDLRERVKYILKERGAVS